MKILFEADDGVLWRGGRFAELIHIMPRLSNFRAARGWRSDL
jgi:hypothetical protein